MLSTDLWFALSPCEEDRLPDHDLQYRPKMSQEGRAPTYSVKAVDECGRSRNVQVAGELPLTLVVDDREIVTLMTLGTHPEALALGFLRNQRLIEDLEEIVSVEVDWASEWVRVTTRGGKGLHDQESKLSGRTVTTGCGQGTVFAHTLDALYARKLPQVNIKRSTVPALLREVGRYNEVYRSAGAVHGCALCKDSEIVVFTEDVGRHNAADAISGLMWLDRIYGGDKIFFTTGRLTSEIVMKTAIMGIPALISRSGVTQMGLELAKHLDMVMIARARGTNFLVFAGVDKVVDKA
jgi:FdhD protein